MSGGMAMFRSQLRSAVREARDGRSPRRRPSRATPAAGRTVVRLWLPLTPLWILLAPFAVLAAPLLTLVPVTRGVSPFRAVFALGATLIALSGTEIDVDAQGALVRIRIF